MSQQLTESVLRASLAVGCKSESAKLDRDTLCWISKLIDVATAADGDVVGEELEGDDFEDGEE